MNNNSIYKVLWVDNDPSIVESTKMIADNYGISLQHYLNWEEAEEEFKTNFNEYSGIILDASCGFGKNDIEDSSFLMSAVSRISMIFGEKHNELPWYILSAGTMEEFNVATHMMNSADRKKHIEDWGELVYLKDKQGDLDRLMLSIKRAAIYSESSKITFRHKGTFEVLRRKNLMDEKAYDIMFTILKALYQPENSEGFDSDAYYNQLRQVVEYLFRSAYELGLLPIECFTKIDNQYNVNLSHSCKYMSGINTPVGVRFGKAGKGEDGANGDTIFPPIIGKVVKHILDFSNYGSHTGSEYSDQYILYGCTLQLCTVIEWYGKYTLEHQDVESNKKMCCRVIKERRVYSAEADTETKDENKEQKETNTHVSYEEVVGLKDNDKQNWGLIYEEEDKQEKNEDYYEGRIMRVERDKYGVVHCGKCEIDYKYGRKAGKNAVLENIVKNKKAEENGYPYFAKRVEFMDN